MLVDYIEALREIKEPDIKAAAEAIASRERVFIMGNGGSASTADHFASDLQKVGVAAVSLCSNTAILTRLANDMGYPHVFQRQLMENKVKKTDVVVVISVSGMSLNILNAIRYAREQGAQTIGLVGFDGGKLIKEVDLSIVVQSKDYGVVEGVHSCLTHIIVDLIKGLKDGK